MGHKAGNVCQSSYPVCDGLVATIELNRFLYIYFILLLQRLSCIISGKGAITHGRRDNSGRKDTIYRDRELHGR